MSALLIIPLIFGLGSIGITFVVVCLLLYFIPALIARNKVHFPGILLLNIFLGWTFIGWIAALIWAVSDSTPAQLNRPVQVNVNTGGTPKKYKCKFCGFEHYEQTTFCPVCGKDDHGMTLEEYRKKAGDAGQA